jgi:hypothetical protein
LTVTILIETLPGAAVGGVECPGDPKECRLRALRCLDLAHKARTTEARTIFLVLKERWEQLAQALDHAHVQLDALRENHYSRLPSFPYD